MIYVAFGGLMFIAGVLVGANWARRHLIGELSTVSRELLGYSARLDS